MKLLICGDYYPNGRVADTIAKGEGSTIFEEVKPYIQNSDFSILNLEYPVVQHDEKPIPKCGPNLKGDEASVKLLADTGFNAVTLANNHILDYGPEAMFNTEQICHKHNLQTVGIGKNIDDSSRPLILEKEGKKVAIINCCEHEFSVASDSQAGANPLNSVKQYYTIQAVRKIVDYIVVIVHGGTEHYQLPSPRMKETYRFFIDAGADVVINHHQHCFSGYELYNEKPIIYGLGNFCFESFGNCAGIWNEGYMVQLKFYNDISFELIPYIQCNDKPNVSLMQGEQKVLFEKEISRLNSIILDDSKLSKEYLTFSESRYDDIQLVCSPYTNRITIALAWRHLLPLFIGKKRISRMLNYIYCESHREKLVSMLQSVLNMQK